MRKKQCRKALEMWVYNLSVTGGGAWGGILLIRDLQEPQLHLPAASLELWHGRASFRTSTVLLWWTLFAVSYIKHWLFDVLVSISNSQRKCLLLISDTLFISPLPLHWPYSEFRDGWAVVKELDLQFPEDGVLHMGYSTSVPSPRTAEGTKHEKWHSCF